MPGNFLKHITYTDNLILTISLAGRYRHCLHPTDEKLRIRNVRAFAQAGFKPRRWLWNLCSEPPHSPVSAENPRPDPPAFKESPLTSPFCGAGGRVGCPKQVKSIWAHRRTTLTGPKCQGTSVGLQTSFLPPRSTSLPPSHMRM